MEHSRRGGLLSGSALKVIAIAAMLIDHIGALLFPHAIWLRLIGRLTFPIMAFFIFEGHRHTRDVKRYALRLLCFALISEVPFDLAHSGRFLDFEYQNIGFTLLLGLLAIECADMGKEWIIGSVVLCLMGDILAVDYGSLGVLTVLMFYVFERIRIAPAASVAASTAFFTLPEWAWSFASIDWGDLSTYRYIPPQSYAIFAIPLLLCYNGKRGKAPWWLFYAFYPGHFLVLYFFGDVIRTALEGFIY